MKRYIYNAGIGTFEIREVSHETYELWIGEEFLGDYENAEFAAQDVANFNTDYPEWDRFENELEHFPSALSEWTKIEAESPQ